jgi:hypothetical protein
MTLEKSRRHRGQPLKLKTRPLQFGQRVLLRLTHSLFGGHLPRGDVLNGDVDLLVDLRI